MTLNAYLAEQDQTAAMQEFFDAEFPGWEDRERFGDTLLDESEVTDLDWPVVTDADWDAFIEDSWVDPAERDI